jgi:soluble lytic murein transglycosylase-like protein
MISGSRHLLARAAMMMCFLLASVPAFAQSIPAHQGMYPTIPWNDPRRPCWDQAAAYHHVDPWLLYAIAKVESGYNPTAMSRPNRNGSVDTGMMQVNSTHWATLRRYGIAPSALLNACASTYIGAWVLSSSQRRYGNTWEAIAAYNVGSVDNPTRRAIGLIYARKVYAAYALLSHRSASAHPSLAFSR